MLNKLIGSALIGASVLLSSVTSVAAEEERFDGVVLRISTWGGTWRDNLRQSVAAQLEARGATVEFIEGTPQTALAKLIAARGMEVPFDLVEMSDNNRAEWSKSGFLANIDYANVPNSADMDKRFTLPDLVSTTQTQDGIIYNVEKLREAGIEPPKSYADLNDPELKGYVSFPDISTVHAIKALSGIARELGGNEGDIDPAMKFVHDLDAQTYWKSAVDLMSKLKTGDVLVAPWHAGQVIRGRRAGIPLAIAFPTIGENAGVLSAVWIGVVKDSPNQRAAEFFINEYLSDEAQYEFAMANGSLPQSAAAVARMAEDAQQNEVLLLTPEERAKIYYPDFGTIDIADWTRRWNTEVLK